MSINITTLNLEEVDRQNTVEASRTVLAPNFLRIRHDLLLLAEAINGLVPGSGTGNITAGHVLNTPHGDITATDVQSALNQLDELISTRILSASDIRALNDITETPFFRFPPVPGGAINSGFSNGTPIGSFGPTIALQTGNLNVLIEVPIGVSLDNVLLRRINATGATVQDIDVSNAPRLTAANAGMDRYGPVSVTLGANEVVRFLHRVQDYRYALSNNYSIPAEDLRDIEFENLGIGLSGILTTLGTEAVNRSRELFEAQTTVARTVASDLLSGLYYSPTSRLSSTLTDYTRITGPAVPINRGGFTIILAPANVEIKEIRVFLTAGDLTTRTVLPFFPGGRVIFGSPLFHGYIIPTQTINDATSNATTLEVFGGVSRNIKVTFNDKVEIGTDNLSTTIREQLASIGSGGGGSGGGPLSDAQTRKLAEISDNAVPTYAAAPGGTVALPNGAVPGTFSATIENITAAIDGKIYFEVNTGTDISELFLQRTTSTGTLLSGVRVSNAVRQATATANKTRYLTADTFPLAIGQEAIIRIRTLTNETYTLSGKYRVPFASVTGFTDPAQTSTTVTRAAGGGLNGLTVEAALRELQTEVTQETFTTAQQAALDNITYTPEFTVPTGLQLSTLPGDGAARYVTVPHTIGTSVTDSSVISIYIALPAALALDVIRAYTIEVVNSAGTVLNTVSVTQAVLSSTDPSGATIPQGHTAYGLALPAVIPQNRLVAGNIIQIGTRATETLVLSSVYRAPSTGVTRTPTTNVTGSTVETALTGLGDRFTSTNITRSGTTDLVGTTVEAALTELQTDVNTRAVLPASQTRALTEITEGSRTVPGSTTYPNVAGSMLAGGGTANNPAGFSPAVMNITSNFSSFIYVEVPSTLTLTDDIRVRQVASDGTVRFDEVLTSWLLQTSASNNTVVRYRRSPSTLLRIGDEIRVQTRTVTPTRIFYDTYTLSSKYRLPVASVTGLTIPDALPASQTRALAEITEVTGFTYAGVVNGTLSVGNSIGGLIVFSPTPTLNINFNDTIPILLEVPTTLTLTDAVRFRQIAAGGAVTRDVPVSSLTRQAAANTGKVRYRTPGNITLTTGDVLHVQMRTAAPATYRLSDKYRAPSSAITRTATTDIAALTLEGALQELHNDISTASGGGGAGGSTGSGGSLTPLDTRKLAGITEATSISYADLTGGQLAFRQGGSAPIFTATIVAAQNESGQIYVEVPEDASLERVSLREYDANGVFINNFGLSGVVNKESTASAGKDRYLTATYIPASAGNVIRLQKATTNYDTYTLSSKYRLPVDGLVGDITATEVVNTPSGKLASTTVQGALNELQGDINTLASKETELPERLELFDDHLALSGTLTDFATASTFYTTPYSSLPEKTLADWTRVTNSQFPQPLLADETAYVVLLADRHPNTLTWDPDAGQTVTTLTRTNFEKVDGSQVPNGFTGWKFTMPAWTLASSTRTGARLQVGALTDVNVSRIDLDSAIKVTDDNLDISNPTTTLSKLQQEKLQGLQLKTFSTDITTQGKTNNVFEVLMATAWPDPDVTYARGVSFAAQRSQYTGNRVVNGNQRFFNLITDTNAVVGNPTPAASGASSLSLLTGSDGPATCSGVFRGTIQVRDRSNTSQMNIDDDAGLCATMSLHIPTNLGNGNYTIMNIGNENPTGRQTVILHKQDATPQIGNAPPDSGLSLRIRELTGASTSTTETRNVPEPLYDEHGRSTHLIHDPAGVAHLDVHSRWVVPSTYVTSSAAPQKYQLFIRVWNNGNDLGEHDFTSSLPSAIQTMAGFDTAIGATNFNIPFGVFGLSGLGDETMRFTYEIPATNNDNRRIIQLSLTDLTNPAFTYAVRVNAVFSRTITIPAGPTRDINFGHSLESGRTHELAFYVHSAVVAANTRRLRYRASVDGSTTTTIDQTSSGAPPTGSVPVTFGGGHGNDIAVNRLSVLKPFQVLTNDQMNELTQPLLRNRSDVGGLVRHSGGTYHEVFSPAYKSVLLTNSASQQLRHGNAANNTATVTAARTNFANAPVPVNIQWVSTDLPPELRFNSSRDALIAQTNFTGQASFDVGVSFTNADMISANTNPKAYLLLVAVIEEQLTATADWKAVPGPSLYHDIRTQLLQGVSERPETTTDSPNALIRRTFSTTVEFKANASYRVRTRGYRLHANANGGFSNTRNWSGNNTTVTLPAGQTFLSINLTPSI